MSKTAPLFARLKRHSTLLVIGFLIVAIGMSGYFEYIRPSNSLYAVKDKLLASQKLIEQISGEQGCETNLRGKELLD